VLSAQWRITSAVVAGPSVGAEMSIVIVVVK